MNYRFLFLCTFIYILSFISSNTAERMPTKSNEFLQGIHDFSTDFYKILAKREKGNFISSPISILKSVGMMAMATNGTTSDELFKALHFDKIQRYVSKNFVLFFHNLHNHEKIELHLANKLFMNEHFDINPSYTTSMERIFRSRVDNIDFENEVDAAEIINSWCRNETRNKITDVIKPSDLKMAQLVMINSVYFKGNWSYPFDKQEEQIFYTSKNNSVLIKMMCNLAEYNYGTILDSNAFYIELPYESNNLMNGYSMYIIFPRGINNVNEQLVSISNRLHELKFNELNTPKTHVHLCMPKFSIESELDLNQTLHDMGIHKIFGDEADFSRLTSTKKYLKITKVIQKAIIHVNSKSSEAAGVTGVVGSIRAMPTYVNIDRPFISVIVAKRYGTPIFWARVNDPRS